ncbi:Myosin type-2 heavy chain 1 [Podochytrium sp. JEL0797]|nr:Myosin type-2 heavy chain 1 [Podochytrium sp. JEL0797]
MAEEIPVAEDPLAQFEKGTKAWFPDPHEGWIVATVKDKATTADAVKIRFDSTRGDRDTLAKEIVFESTFKALQANKYASLPPLKNPPMLEGIDDLSNLSYLHEPAVLHNIRLRYLQEQIYTYSGLVLIAMNPFQRLALYSSDIMREYSGKHRGELEPHLFAVAEEAYRTMIRDKRNQSIIVSGESGAGKTQSAKYIMRYFATVDNLEGGGNGVAGGSIRSGVEGKDGKSGGGISEIEEAVLSTNPILESFGNSKTTRNDNSSRFGKYIEILFSKPSGPTKNVNIVGARIRTYLLERSRLIFKPAYERNYHIFYQLCAAVPAAERKELGLGRWNEFHYLNQGGSGAIHGFDDAAEFAVTQQALSTIGISVSMQWSIFKICAALLHIGNIKIESHRDGESSITDTDPALAHACKLLQIDATQFAKWITKKQMTTRSEKITSNLNAYQATVGRDSVAKYIYTLLFDWLVRVINANLWRDEAAETAKGGEFGKPGGGCFIGVLDIYGFEHFKTNSFEQFCINYANEKLQQEFNQHVFKLEQEEYVAEKIQWSFIDFNDNQPCIDLIEGKLGILDLLDEESRLPSGSDGSLITKLYQRFDGGKHKFFQKPRFGQTAFTVKHYAVDVTYEIEAFIEKNKDTVSDEQLGVLNVSEFGFLKEVLHIEEPVAAVEAPSRMSMMAQVKKPTLGTIFRGSLVNLMTTLRHTQVHYIRCIKPNHTKTAFGFEPQLVLSQLRACGVLETIRISCAGYPSRWTFQEFSDRYYILVPSTQWCQDARQLTHRIVSYKIQNPDLCQLGLTKIFFRAGQLASLEKQRSDKLRYCVVLIQKNIRRFVYRQEFLRRREAAVAIQTAFRGYQARVLYKQERENRAAIKIQTAFRRHAAMKHLSAKLDAIILIQSTFRMRQAMLQYRDMRLRGGAVKIQSAFRGYQTRKEYRKSVQLIVLLQSSLRRKQAVAAYKVLQVEAKSVGKLKELNYTLENKVVELSVSVKNYGTENRALSDKVVNLESQLVSWKEKFARMEHASKVAGEGSSEVKAELRAAVEAKEGLQREVDRFGVEMHKKDVVVASLQSEVAKVRDELRKVKEELLRAPPVVSAAATAPVSVKTDDSLTVLALRKENTQLREQVNKLSMDLEKAPVSSLSLSDSTSRLEASRSQPRSATKNVETSSAVSGGPRGSVEFTVRSDKVQSLHHVDLPYLIASLTGLLCILGLRLLDQLKPTPSFDDKALEDEIIDSLITNLRIPLPSTQTVATRPEIFFPAHLIGLSMKTLLLYNLGSRTQTIMSDITTAIQLLTKRFEDDYVSAFWLSNCFELTCISKFIQQQMETRYRSEFEGSETEVTLVKVQTDLSDILNDIYTGWVKVLKRRLSNMIVPAVVENQSLPAYMSKQSGASWSKVGKTPGGTQFKIEQLLNFLTKLSKTLKCYYMHEKMSAQILTELVRAIGVSSFNHILVRKNFCNWKRGMQLQYNVQRLEEWCQIQQIPEAMVHLQHFKQAAKLLILLKSPPSDPDILFKECSQLNGTQIKKLLLSYYATDFDSPLPPKLVHIINSRAGPSDESSSVQLSLDLERMPEFEQPRWQPLVSGIDSFVPQWISLPHIQALLE